MGDVEGLGSPVEAAVGQVPWRVAIIGGGPAGLMAAETLLAGNADFMGVSNASPENAQSMRFFKAFAENAQSMGISVDIYDAMPSVGRKFLLAGIGGLNLTHGEPLASFLPRYGGAQAALAPMIRGFSPDDLRAWAKGLGVDTFVGTSGRVFPTEKKAAPLLRAWLARLRRMGVRVHTRHRWLGWEEKGSERKEQRGETSPLRFSTTNGAIAIQADAVILALGGASWAKLGSDGAWVPWLQARGVEVSPLRPANCGFERPWSTHFAEKFAGQPVKRVTASITDIAGHTHQRMGEFVVTKHGVEGSLIYAFSKPLRELVERDGQATLTLDLSPNKSLERLTAEIGKPRGTRSMGSHMQSQAGIAGVQRLTTRPNWRRWSKPCRSLCAPRARWTKRSAPQAACAGTRLIKTSCCAPSPACFARAKCLIGKHPPAAICSRRVLRRVARRAQVRARGCKGKLPPFDGIAAIAR
jgi:uncharacterized flavoprotein (TIGR03862 family)